MPIWLRSSLLVIDQSVFIIKQSICPVLFYLIQNRYYIPENDVPRVTFT